MAPSSASSNKVRPSPAVHAMKQGKLSFASSKRNASASAAGKDKTVGAVKAVASVPTTPAPSTKASPSISISSTSEDDVVEVKKHSPAPAAARANVSSSVPQKRGLPVDDSSSESEPEEPQEDIEALERSGRLNAHFGEVSARMGGLRPIHAEKQGKVHAILRVFDLSDEYGPCVGVTRMQRWERAYALGLNPPQEVRDILMTKQAIEDDVLRQSVFYDEL